MNVVDMKNITKIFYGMVVNDDINFSLKEKEVHVILGENGAGKTTLMNILYGLYTQEKGEVFVRGKQVNFKTPKDAIINGIGMVHQHFMLVHNFTVSENIVLGSEPTKAGLLYDKNKSIEDVKKLIDKYEFNIDPTHVISDISVGQQQKVEILKTLYRGADIIILDEPTAALTPNEIKELELIIKNLTNEGKSIILITHKLKEIMSMSDRVTIIRRGKIIDTVNTKDTSIDELANLMVGRPIDLNVYVKPNKEFGNILEVKDVKAKDNRGIDVLKGVNFSLKAGQIFGIAGVSGNGQTELIEILTGLRKVCDGQVVFDGERIENLTPKQIINKKISSIPEDRHKTGLVLQHSLYENAILGMQNNKKFSGKIMLNYKSIKKFTSKIIKEFDVRTPSEEVVVSQLSGGNQQKLIVGREIYKDPKLIIAAQPTRGLDVGAIEYIHRRLIEERDKGKAILLVSLELDEILSLSDIVAVMYDGKIVGILERDDANESKVGVLMAGGSI